MSAIRRIVSVSVASATVIGLIMPVGDAPPAMAAACSSPEANVPPPAGMPNIPSPGPVAPPTGRRPRGTNDNAPLPKLGPLISSLLKAIPRQGTAQLQAAVTPVPPVPGAAVPQSPNANQAVPEAVPVPPTPPAGIAGAPTSLVDFVTGTEQPEPNPPTIRYLRHGSRDSLGQR